MKKKLMTKYVVRLFRFMLPFGIDRFQVVECNDKSIKAIVGWPDEGQLDYDPEEEVQEIVWDIQDFDFLDDALEIMECAFSEGFFDSDKILISEDELRQLISWDKSRFNNALQDLLKVRVDMVEAGAKTDYFFVHF